MRLRLWGALLAAACTVGTMGSGAGTALADPPAGTPSASPSTVTALYQDSTTIPGIPTFGGISGIDRAGNGQYVMISTDVGRHGPARVFDTTIPFVSGMGFTTAPTVTGGGTVLGPFNLPMLPGSAQFEGIRERRGGFVVVSGGPQQFVRLIGNLGNFETELRLPAAYRSTKRSGLAGQRGLTGVAVTPSGKISAITAGGLRQDGAHASRLLSWRGGKNSEFVYRTDGDKVAADLLAVNDTDYLVLERGRGRTTRIYWTTTRGATPVTGKARLSGGEQTMRKRQIFSTAPLPGLVAGNMSGLAWGNWLSDRPWLKYRARMLYVVTNDVFAGPTRVHALEVRFPKG